MVVRVRVGEVRAGRWAVMLAVRRVGVRVEVRVGVRAVRLAVMRVVRWVGVRVRAVEVRAVRRAGVRQVEAK